MADNRKDYNEQDIRARNSDIMETFIKYMNSKNLIK